MGGPLSGKTILVTGASSGIGLAVARLLVDSEAYVVLTARQASLGRFADAGIEEDERVWIRAMDVVLDSERRRVVDEIEHVWGGVDILINNAGIAYRSVVEHVAPDERHAQMEINYRAPMELARLVLPGMRQKRAGRIINVSSVSGMVAMPTMAVYAASKFALEGATEALWYEVRPFGIQVSLVQPGFVHSSSFRNTHLTRLSEHSIDDQCDPYHAHYEYMEPFIARLMSLSFATPERVAKKIVHTACRRHPPLRVPATIDASFFTFLRRLLPRSVYHFVLFAGLPGVRRWGRLPAPAERVTRSGISELVAESNQAERPLSGGVAAADNEDKHASHAAPRQSSGSGGRN